MQDDILVSSASVTESFRQYGLNTPSFSFAGLFTPARVVSIMDGDTCKIVIHWKDMFCKLTVRMDGIDTCEKTSKNADHQRLALDAKKTFI
jgi:endonuclease YncB( thermonuclease family)